MLLNDHEAWLPEEPPIDSRVSAFEALNKRRMPPRVPSIPIRCLQLSRNTIVAMETVRPIQSWTDVAVVDEVRFLCRRLRIMYRSVTIQHEVFWPIDGRASPVFRKITNQQETQAGQGSDE
jgi:hypothetical protein